MCTCSICQMLVHRSVQADCFTPCNILRTNAHKQSKVGQVPKAQVRVEFWIGNISKVSQGTKPRYITKSMEMRQ